MGSFYRSQHELVLIFKKGDAPHINNFELGQNGRYRTNVWSYPGVNSFGKGQELLKLHPTVKPVSLVADAIRDCSCRQGIILDSFGGSGTTLVAAERTGRQARLIELDPGYVDVSILRWQRITGKEAVLLNTGQTWRQIVEERRSLLPTTESMTLPSFAEESAHGDIKEFAEPACASSLKEEIPLQHDSDSSDKIKRFCAQDPDFLLDGTLSAEERIKRQQLILETIAIIDSELSPSDPVSGQTTELSHSASLNEGDSHEL